VDFRPFSVTDIYQSRLLLVCDFCLYVRMCACVCIYMCVRARVCVCLCVKERETGRVSVQTTKLRYSVGSVKSVQLCDRKSNSTLKRGCSGRSYTVY
jgi:hypothetical protein